MGYGIEIGNEFRHADLGDPRRTRRAQQIVETLSEDPAQPFPAVFTEAELEAFYRFAKNEAVDPSELLRSHAKETASRIASGRRVLVLHDTTQFEFTDGIEREGLGYIKRYKKNPKKWKTKADVRGFFGHFSLAVGQRGVAEYEPLGLLSLIAVNRVQPRARVRRHASGAECAQLKDREAQRWLDGVTTSSERLLEPGEAIHVMDREADKYWLLDDIAALPARFVIRANHNRRLLDDEQHRLHDKLEESLQVALKRSVSISARKEGSFARDNRKHPPRQARVANLEVRAFPVRLQSPNYHPDRDGYPTHVVWVYEPEPPEGCDPVEWLLYTNEPIDTAEQVAAVVDAYRARWLIEELFKCIKTGCKLQERRLESYTALLTTLVLFVPIAIRLLLLRHTARTAPNAPATNVLSRRQIKLLGILCPKQDITDTSTAQKALMAVASLGGHLKRNGWPGWLVLRRGMEKLLQAEQIHAALEANL